jgi:hypothetical protein
MPKQSRAFWVIVSGSALIFAAYWAPRSWRTHVATETAAGCQRNSARRVVPPDLSAPRVVQRFQGDYHRSFEVSSFVPAGGGCAGYGRGYWLESEVEEFYLGLDSQMTKLGIPYNYPGHVDLEFDGYLGQEEHVGHMNEYAREVHGVKLVSVTLSKVCTGY